MNNEFPTSFVGIFWAIVEHGQSQILSDKVPLAIGELYGSFISWGEHYNFWEKLR